MRIEKEVRGIVEGLAVEIQDMNRKLSEAGIIRGDIILSPENGGAIQIVLYDGCDKKGIAAAYSLVATPQGETCYTVSQYDINKGEWVV